jgi:outer membrane protein assembly factor BamB
VVRKRVWPAAFGILLAAGNAGAAAIDSGQLLYSTEGNRLRRFDVDTVSHPPLREDVLIRNASEGESGPSGGAGRDVNGMVCRLADGRLVMGEDTGQPAVRPGWGLFTAEGEQVGKLAARGHRAQPEPFGCAVDGEGRLFTTEVGDPLLIPGNGQLILWLPPYEGFPGAPGTYPNGQFSSNYCVIDDTIGAATGIALDEDGSVLVSSPRANQVLRFSGSWPTAPDAAGGCGRTSAIGSPLVDAGRITRSELLAEPVFAASGLARGPNGNWFVSSVLFGSITEFSPAGVKLRDIVPPPPAPITLPTPNGSPQSLAFGADGTLYYADLDLRGIVADPDTGPDGKVRRVRFDENGDPHAPEIVRGGLAFPDGVTMLPGDLEPAEWRMLGGGLERTYFQAAERRITAASVGQLRVRWRHPTGAIVSASPTVATIELPGEGRTPVAFVQSWDETIHALRVADGSVVWTFVADLQPGSAYPGASSATIETVAGEDVVFIGSGEILYALDAVTGQERWRFTAGTGCGSVTNQPPGLCGFDGERNQIESSPVVVGDTVYFGMDVNDEPTGKGGFYGVDVATGALRWFFDLESGQTCRPLGSDFVTRYDGYHTAAELGLPADFFATRPGCDHPRHPYGCSNVWSSAAVDLERGLLFTASSNCDTDEDPQSNPLPPPMPPFDEAIFALALDGEAMWRWRPREVDNDDLAFGGVPNLFTIRDGEDEIDVVGVGNKDGTYYVLDRDGVNERNGVAWDDADPSQLPYWATNVVPGGAIGGIIASAAVDVEGRRVFFATAPGVTGDDVFDPQRPIMHALDLDTGAVVWQGGAVEGDASYSPASAIPGLVFTGGVVGPELRAWDAETGELRFAQNLSPDVFANAVTSAVAVVDGTVITGTGIGTRTGDPHDAEDFVSRLPREVIALWVPEPGTGLAALAAAAGLGLCAWRAWRRHGSAAAGGPPTAIMPPTTTPTSTNVTST